VGLTGADSARVAAARSRVVAETSMIRSRLNNEQSVALRDREATSGAPNCVVYLRNVSALSRVGSYVQIIKARNELR